MKKLLYITVNSKPEALSTSKLVGRRFVERFLAKNTDYELEELDLYKEYIPEINHRIFTSRGEPVKGAAYETLSLDDKIDVDRIHALCNQFLMCDTYVIAAPMWSMNFPSRLKQYIDCVIINNKTISIADEEVTGLLNNKERDMYYIQSSGGTFPILFSGKYHHGIDYVHDVFKFLGINSFQHILVQGVDIQEIGKAKAVQKAYEDIDELLH